MSPSIRNILITGGAGFIGSHLADDLLAHGYRVRALDNLTPAVHGPARQRPAYLANQVELVKLPHQLVYWNRYSDEKKSADIAALQGLDWFIVHQPLLTSHPDLMKAVNASFAVETFFYEHGVYERLGPIYVLRKRRGESDERTFFDVERDLEAKEYQRQMGL